MLPIIGVSYLGVIRTRHELAALRVREGLEGIIEGMALPDLKVVRLLSEENPVNMDPENWSKAIEICRDRSLRLEDAHGQALIVSQSDNEGESEVV